MPSESSSTLQLPSLLAQLRSPSTATASLISSSAADSTSIHSHHSDDDDETSSLEGLARRLNTARNAKRSVHRNRISSSTAAEPVLSSSPPPTTATGPASLRRSDSASSSSAAAAASASASSSSSGTLNRQRHARDDDHRDDGDDDQDGAGKGAVKDEEEEADTEDDDDEGEDDRVQFISRSEGHPDPRDLLRAQLSAANTATTATSSPPSSRTRRQGDEILQSNKKAQGQENPNPTRWVSSSSRRVVRDQQRQTRAASPPSSALYEESGRSVSLQPAGSSAASSAMSVTVGGCNSTATAPTDADAVTDSEANLIKMMYLPRRYFILSTAGKLVYTSDSSEEAATGLVGVMQAIVSIFADEGDKIRYIDVGQTKISFLLKAPLYLVVVSSQGEPEAVLRQHLDYLYLQVLSVVTVSQLQNIFAKRSNFDLRQLISGTEPFFDSLVSTLQTSLAVALSSISVYRLPPTLRSDLARALDPGKETIRSLDLLYVLLLAEGRLVTLLRPKKHSIHPTDLHLLLETVYAPRRTSSSSDETESGPPGGDEDDEDEAGQTGGGGENLDQRQQRSKPRPRPRPRPRRRPSPLLEPGAESWFPICLPRFNPRGFLHAYVSFLETSPTSSASSSLGFESRAGGEGGGGGGGEGGAKAEDGIGVVILSSRRDAFVGVQQVAQAIKARLLSSSSSSSSAISTGGGGVSSGSFSSSTPHHPPLPAPPSTSISTSASTAAAAGAADGGLVHSILMSRAHQSYSLGELAIPGLRHFVYKDRERVQVTMPRWEGEYYAAAAAISEEGADDDDDDDAVAASTRARMRLVTLYQRLHAALHPRTSAATVGGREGGGGGASVQYLRTSHEAVLGWMTNDFELYVSTSPLLPPAAMVKCARRVSEWVKRDEARLFLSGKGAGVF